MQTIEFEGRDISYPGAWNEMSRKQLISVSGLLLQQLSPFDFKLRLILKWLKLENRIFQYDNASWYIYGIYRINALFALWGIKTGKVRSFDYSDIYLLSETMNFLLREDQLAGDPSPVTRNNQLTRQLIPSIRAGKTRLYGPLDKMKNITSGEYAKAEHRYLAFIQSGDEKYLNEMIAVLYRPRRRFAWLLRFFQLWDGEKRVPFHDYHLARANDIAQVELNIRFAVFLFFEGCRNHAVENHPNVFSEGTNEENGGWAGIFQAISEKPTDIEELTRLNFWTLLFFLEQKAIHAAGYSPNPNE